MVKSAAVSSSGPAMGWVMPAECSNPAGVIPASSIAYTAMRTDASSDTSYTRWRVSRRSAVALREGRSRSKSTTVAPRSTKRSAHASPIPLAPVTRMAPSELAAAGSG
jgi:hypothetical protein